MLRAADFSDEECEVIRERRKYQPASELAAVFSTTPQVIAAICRKPVHHADHQLANRDRLQSAGGVSVSSHETDNAEKGQAHHGA